MPDHIHLLISPNDTLERAMQLIKGGFSFKAKRELNWLGDIWQKGFSDHRIRDFPDLEIHLNYIRLNPVKARLCSSPEEYPYASLAGNLTMDPIPQRLKPPVCFGSDGGAEAPPLQSARLLQDQAIALPNIKL
jgi:putative transposase